jgi:hypothetical protein
MLGPVSKGLADFVHDRLKFRKKDQRPVVPERRKAELNAQSGQRHSWYDEHAVRSDKGQGNNCDARPD